MLNPEVNSPTFKAGECDANIKNANIKAKFVDDDWGGVAEILFAMEL